jgi:hypothetical protein
MLWDGITKRTVKIGDMTGESFFWQVPDSLQGDRFRINVIQKNSDCSKNDFSDNFFEIRHQQQIEQCKVESLFKTTVNTGISVTSWSITVIPNPSRSILSLRFSNQILVHSLSIVDIMGVKLHAEMLKNAPIDSYSRDISELNKGIYFILLELNDGSMQVVKFIKE